MLVKEIEAKGSPQLNLVLLRHNALNNDAIIRLYFNDWALIQSMRGFGEKRHAELKAILNAMKVKGGEKMKKRIYLEAKVKGFHDHIKDIEQTLFDNFWELMETVSYNFEVSNSEYINIIDRLINSGRAVVGDYYITVDNQNADNLELLNETLKELKEMED